MYTHEQKSVKQISKLLSCSENKINYWLRKYSIEKRTISNALYVRHNPEGDPFRFNIPKTNEEYFLFGLGLGLYWGEGNKRNKYSIRLGNTDPRLIEYFIHFLEKMYTVRKEKMRFGLQVFNDGEARKALIFWTKTLGISPKQIGNVVVTPSRGKGTYKRKTPHGVLSVSVSNVRLRNLICQEIEKLREMD